MKSVPKLIRRFLAILLLSTILLFILNIIVLATLSLSQTPVASPWTTARETGDALTKTAAGGYVLAEDAAETLKSEHVWAIFIDNTTHRVAWHTENLPPEIPMEYTLADTASLTRGYLMDYPTFPAEASEGMVVLGYPKDRYWKHMYPNWDYHFIADLPKYALNTLLINALLIFLIYFIANLRLLRSVSPITEGIQTLPTRKPVHIKEKGLLSELAASINQTSEILKSQNYQLRKKDSARANWIAGVSHDIRTPLSMVMGYAGQLAEDPFLTEDARRKASVILRQSERIRNLVNDLNLASRLEYDMQPLHRIRENAVALARQSVVNFMNMEIDGIHAIEWKTSPEITDCPVSVDKDLILRAVTNLIQNCINHNPDGCTVYVSVTMRSEPNASMYRTGAMQNGSGIVCLRVEDDGAGMPPEMIRKLNAAPHYMMCDSNVKEQRHGLGLQIVRQIAGSHGGDMIMRQSGYGGLCVDLLLPAYMET